LSTYTYLIGTTHYDDEDKAVFKVAKIQAENFHDGKGVVVVVYRQNFNETTRKWGKVDLNDPIMVGDVIKYHNSYRNRQEMHTRLRGVSTNASCNQSNTKSNRASK
jgi:hypothetical protein